MEDKRTVNKADNESKTTKQVQLDIKTDIFSEAEQEKIVKMVKRDIEADMESMRDWIQERKRDIQMYDGEKPSIIENLNKEDWMSDRNMGLCAANCDAYQATLLATCYNIDRIHFKDTEENDIDRKEQLEKFTEWGLGEKEANFFPEVDDFIHNKVGQGISYFYIYWDVWYDWVDRRIPIFDSQQNFKRYEIKTEYKRFERGVIENIANVSDLLYPAHGNTLQKKEHLIYRMHKNARDIIDLSKRKIFVALDDDYIRTLRKHCFDNRLEILSKEKCEALGIMKEEDLTEADLKMFPIDLYQWYGKYKKENGNEEEYRFIIEPQTNKFLAGKPLRKITRSGKRPFVGRPFIRRPGMVQGRSLPSLIEDPVNAFNNTYNQKSDFQYVENCPFGWYNPDEGFKKQDKKIKPGTLLATQDPDSVNIPNLTRSLAWADSDFKLFFQVIEMLTGAASYFMTNRGPKDTATRDVMINEKSDTRFGLWVNRIIMDLNEAITMWLQMYQDWASPELGKRILGDDGKKLFPNFSIETIRGGYDANLTPDIISGSKTLEKEIALWALDRLSQTPWFDPMINPKGNWNLTVHAAKKSGFASVEKFMPPEPKAQFNEGKNVKDKWTQLSQGQMPEIEEGDDIMELYMGFTQLAAEEIDSLDKEYRPNLEVFMFKLNIAMFKEMQRMEQERRANAMAMSLVRDVEDGRLKKEEVIDA